jgi:hypothetical protein
VQETLIEDLKPEVPRSGIDASVKVIFLDGVLMFHDPNIRRRLELMLLSRHRAFKQKNVPKETKSFF